MPRERPDALFFQGDGLTNQHGEQIVDFVTQSRIPNLFDQTGLTTAGGLQARRTAVSLAAYAPMWLLRRLRAWRVGERRDDT